MKKIILSIVLTVAGIVAFANPVVDLLQVNFVQYVENSGDEIIENKISENGNRVYTTKNKTVAVFNSNIAYIDWFDSDTSSRNILTYGMPTFAVFCAVQECYNLQDYTELDSSLSDLLRTQALLQEDLDEAAFALYCEAESYYYFNTETSTKLTKVW